MSMAKRGKREVVTVEIIKEVYDQYKKQAMEQKQSVRSFINETLQIHLEKSEALQMYAPYLEFIGCNGDILYIKDHKKDVVVEIRMKNKKLYSNRNDPVYLQFAWALPELTKLQNES